MPAATAQQWGLVTRSCRGISCSTKLAHRDEDRVASVDEAIQNTREGLAASLRATIEGQRDITIFSNQLLASLFEQMGATSS